MYTWKIEIVLRSGKEITVYYKGDESSSLDVANKMLIGNENAINGFGDKDHTKHIFVRIGEIASASISEAKGLVQGGVDMNKLPLFKTGDLLKIIKNALEDYDGINENTDDNMYEGYTIYCDDVSEAGKHCLDVVVLETKTHFPWQVGDVDGAVNNKFRIKIERT